MRQHGFTTTENPTMPKTAEPNQYTPKLEDLSVYRRDAETLQVYSHLTRGLCATVYKFSFSDHYNIQPTLISSYMQGITFVLINAAVEKFVAEEAAKKAQKVAA